jgi:hypothetical protein
VNWQHFQAFVWLRWRLLINQWRRGGAINAVLMIILSIAAVVTAVPLFIGCFALGVYLIPKASPAHLMYAWDVLIVGLLFFWGIGLITELQRSDPLSLSKFLHLPVSAVSAFLINYLSSLFRLSLIIFVPVMLGFGLALIYVKGISLLPVLPLSAAFLLMVTALTYQFQGWLASLMINPRRRRTVIVVTTTAFILIAQLPNLLNFLAPWGPRQQAARSEKLSVELAKLEAAFKAHQFDAAEYLRRQEALREQNKLAYQQAFRESGEQFAQGARLVNAVLPVGWLPLGVMAAAEGRFLPVVLGLAGMTLIGTASLWRAYRTTVGLYQGQATNQSRRPLPTSAPAAEAKQGSLLLEARIPGLSAPVAAIALAGFRSLVRSPEAKMTLLTPIIVTAVFGSMMLGGRGTLPELVRPLVAIGAMGFVLMGVLQLTANQFGFDRDGFRVFVLCSVPRRDILLGKNLAFAPMALGMGLILLAIVQFFYPMRLDHFLAMFPLLVTMFVLFCVFTNLLSIYAPVHIAAGSLKPSNLKLSTALLQLVMFIFLFPLTQGLALVPLGAEALSTLLGWTQAAPICLLLSLAECAAVVALSRVLLAWQGQLLQAREQKILEAVTQRAA